MLLKPSCSWCKNWEKFAEVRQLKILLSCYKKLCEYIAATPIARSFVGANGESNSTLTILQEGMAINAVHESTSNIPGKKLNILDILATVTPDKTANAFSKSPGKRRGRPRRETHGVGASPNPHLAENPEVPSPAAESPLDGLCNGIDSSDHLDMSSDHSMYSASFSSSGTPRIKIKRKRHSDEQKVKSKKKKKKHDKDKDRKLSKEHAKRLSDRKARSERKKRRHQNRKDSEERETEPVAEKQTLLNGDAESTISSSPTPDTPKKKSVVISGHRAKMLKAGLTIPVVLGCRCGTWGKSPGANTCRGNRCPCFMSDKGCHRCKCRGCRNPFVVPDTPPPKKRNRHSSRNEVNGELESDGIHT